VLGLSVVAALNACSDRGGRGGDGAPDPAGVDARIPAGVDARIDDHRSFAPSIVVAALEVWPIVTDAPLDLGEFTTLQEAQAAGLATIREREDGADVRTLELENRGDLPLLLCAGTLLRGGQQDRQIGQDLVVAAHSKVDVDAFCVEPDRWSEGTGPATSFEAQPCVAVEAVRASAQYGRDQAAVWEGVGRANAVACGENLPPTGTLLATFDPDDEITQQRREERARAVLFRFDQLRRDGAAVVGFAYAIGGAPVSVRTFAHPRLLESQLPAFVTTMCIEADLAAANGDADFAARRADLAAVVALVHESDSAGEEIVKTTGSSELRVRRGDRSGSSKCLLPALGFSLATITEDWTRR